MYGVCFALLPAALAGIYFFLWKALALMIICIVSCVITEAIFQRLRGKKIRVGDGSAILTGLLLAMIIPPDLPLWAAALGSVFAIGIGKECFGGLGCNIFNPALLGRAFLSAAFPAFMTVYTKPYAVTSLAAAKAALGVDAVTTATPLGLMKFEGAATDTMSVFLGNVAGSVGETSAIALLIGGAFLIIKKYADWRIPLAYIGTTALFGGIMYMISPDSYPSVAFQLLSGGLLIGAIFMATDPVTSPVTKKGRWIFAIGCAFLTVTIRLWGGLPEGVMYAILLMNAVTPIINKLTRPKRFGT